MDMLLQFLDYADDIGFVLSLLDIEKRSILQNAKVVLKSTPVR